VVHTPENKESQFSILSQSIIVVVVVVIIIIITLKRKAVPQNNYVGARGGGIAPPHSRPRHWME
jgi:hypothetical protein